MEKNPTILRKTEKQVTQSEKFNVKESWRYNVLVLINHHLDIEKFVIEFRLINEVCLIYFKRREGIIYTDEGGIPFNQ